MIVWLIAFGIIALFIALIVAAKVREGRIDAKVADTASWLETEATIQSAVMERLDKYTWYPGFAFSYAVNGEYSSGKFFLKVDQSGSDELIKTLVGQKFSIQYDPENPSSWYMAESTMAGFEIIQELSPDFPSDSGPYRNDGDQPIDLHLDR